jgi:CitMHS family citrate-Mg2+:H+ or citrate-Ca2+:H+ symporter
MYLAIAGFVMIVVFMALIMTKKMSPILSLMLIPVLFALGLGFDIHTIGKIAMAGVKKVAPTGVMLFFAIIYFSLMLEAGMFDGIIKKILIWVKGDPVKICVGTAALATCISLDGDGSTTYLVCTSALILIHSKVGIRPVILPAIVLLENSVMNILPWGGPTARVLAALHLELTEVFNPMIPGMVLGTIYVWFMAYYWGKQERKRIGTINFTEETATAAANTAERDESVLRPKLVPFNLILTVLVLVILIADVLPSAIVFMLGTGIALMANYPNMKQQSSRLAEVGSNAVPVVGMVFAAGILTGIMTGTKMIDAMSVAIVGLIPESLGSHMAFISSFLSLPGVFFLTNDAYYFGVLPVLEHAASNFGIPAAQMGIAALIGQGAHLLSPLVPSTYLLVGLNKIELADLQKFAILPAIGVSLIWLLTALALGIIHF